MRIAVFGLGYVGAVSIAALADAGHELVGVDANPDKVDMVRAGRSPVIEAGVDELMASGVRSLRIRATTDARVAVEVSDVAIICVGTPSLPNGNLDLTQVEKVCGDIGAALAARSAGERYVVVARSTMLPGSMADIVIPALERSSGLTARVDFGIAFNPEFLREGTAIRDFHQPPFTLIGADDEDSAARVRAIYASVDAENLVVPINVAEMVKYTSNAYHALKVDFANEIGAICKASGIDGRAVMDVFVRDTRLNVSAAYLRPGFAFGGSCLPKDVRALAHHARRNDVKVPLLDAILPGNEAHLERALALVKACGSKRVGVLGFSFKAGTDDLRESPTVELIERLIGKGYDVGVYDRNVSLANLQGANRVYIEREIPHVASLMHTSAATLLDAFDVLIVGNPAAEFVDVLAATEERHTVIDLVGLLPEPTPRATYHGLCW